MKAIQTKLKAQVVQHTITFKDVERKDNLHIVGVVNDEI
jgi:hypothetical protein